MKRRCFYSTDILPLALFGKRLDTIDFSRPILKSWRSTAIWKIDRNADDTAPRGHAELIRQLGLKPEQALCSWMGKFLLSHLQTGPVLPDLLHRFLTLRWCASWFDFKRYIAA